MFQKFNPSKFMNVNILEIIFKQLDPIQYGAYNAKTKTFTDTINDTDLIASYRDLCDYIRRSGENNYCVGLFYFLEI